MFSSQIMKKGNYISAILRSKQTVFSFREIMLLWEETGVETARTRVNYYVKNKALYQLRRGLYAKDKSYNRLELATKIFTPSYVSFETVLAEAGIVFQMNNNIFAASYLSREIECDNHSYSYKKIKIPILTSDAGIEDKGCYFTASKERAFLDTLYLNKDYHFDNLSPIDWKRVETMLSIYKNARMEKTVRKYQKL